MKVSVTFDCPACGLRTPVFANIPEGTNPKRPVNLEARCHHCDCRIEKQYESVALLMKQAEKEDA